MVAEEISKLIGQTGDVTIMEVEKGAIRRYAHAVDDSNPLYLDDEYARDSVYGSTIAPPGFFGWPTRWKGNMPVIPNLAKILLSSLQAAGYSRLLDGGIEYEFLSPVRAGDTLAALARITRIAERETKGGKLAFSIVETTYTNQSGVLVATARQTFISR